VGAYNPAVVSQVGIAGGRKRSRQMELEAPQQRSGAPRSSDEKRGCAEGMSWWTCLLLGVDQSMTRQQVISKKN